MSNVSACLTHMQTLGIDVQSVTANGKKVNSHPVRSGHFSSDIHSVSIKSSPFYFCDNFPNCKPIQIIFGRNIAGKIWNKLTRDHSLYIASSHRKMTPIFLSIPQRKNSNVTFQTVCDDDTLIEIVSFSLSITISVINFT